MATTRSTARALLAMSGALVIAGCGSSTTTTQPVVVTNLRVNGDTQLARNLDEPVLLVDRSNDNTVYMFGIELLTGDCRFYTSTDRGYTWTKGASPATGDFNSCNAEGGNSVNFRATLSQANDGTLLLAFAARNPSTQVARSVQVARSTDRGHNWSTVTVDAGAPEPSAGFAEINFEPHLAIDPTNQKHLFVTWRRSNVRAKVKGTTLPPTRAYESTSTDGGATWSTPQMMFDRTMGFDPPYPVFVGSTIYVSWHETFPAPSDSAPSPPDKLWLSSSTDGGKTWTDHLIDQNHSPNVDTPVLLYDAPRGRFYAFWDDDRNGGYYDVYFSTSGDLGKTWSASVRLNDDSKSSHRDHEMPAPALTANGRLDVVWYDYRNDPYPYPTPGNLGNRDDVYTSSSSDGGATWTANTRVNTLIINRLEGTWNNQYFIQVPPAAASANTWAVAAWSDTRLGDNTSQSQDMFAAPMALTSSVIPAGYAGATVAGYDKSDVIVIGLIGGVAGLLGGAGLALLFTALRRRRAEGT